MKRLGTVIITLLAAIMPSAAQSFADGDMLVEEFTHSSMSPQPLIAGDRIAIVSPASIIRPQTVHAAVPVLRDQGWEVITGRYAFNRHGTYAGTDAERLADLSEALTDPAVSAVLCSRGGYGLVHIIESLAALPLEDNQKWVIGFSDISALHALLTSRGIPSIHASMTEHIAHGADDPDNAALFGILRGEGVSHTLEADPRNRQGVAEATLVGGNLSVIAGLIGTPYDVLKPGVVLFVEDVNEPIYKLERIFYNLKLAGILPRLKGLIVGKFAKCSPDADFDSVESMIERLVEDYDFPVAYNVPIGHVSHNIPVICGAPVILDVAPDAVTITQR